MKDGVTREQLAAELTRLSKQIPERFGGSPAYARVIGQHRALVEPLLDATVGPTARRSLWLLLGAVGVVLLIACANVANLFAVRAEGRVREMTVRRAIGATRARLVRLQMAEAVVVALAAGALALVLARVTLPLFIAAAPRGGPAPRRRRHRPRDGGGGRGRRGAHRARLRGWCPRCAGRRPISRACARVAAAPPGGGAGDVTRSSSPRRRSPSSCSSAPRCWCRAS
jgi:hypothetical protein